MYTGLLINVSNRWQLPKIELLVGDYYSERASGCMLYAILQDKKTFINQYKGFFYF